MIHLRPQAPRRVWFEEIREFLRGGRLDAANANSGNCAGDHFSQETPLVPAAAVHISAAAE